MIEVAEVSAVRWPAVGGNSFMTALFLFAISHEFITKYLKVPPKRKDRSRLDTLVMAVQNELSVPRAKPILDLKS